MLTFSLFEQANYEKAVAEREKLKHLIKELKEKVEELEKEKERMDREEVKKNCVESIHLQMWTGNTMWLFHPQIN